jgi:uncharacterized protein YkwD
MFSPVASRLRFAAVLAGALPLGAGMAQAQEAAKVASAINSYRSSKGLKTLSVNAALERAAQKYAQFLAGRDQTSAADWHTVDGRSPQQRAAAEGYTSGVWENVQLNWGYSDPAAKAMEWWKNSPGHNANMLNAGHTAMGVGAARSASGKWFFVAMFGQQGGTSGGTTGGGTGGAMKKVTVQVRNETRKAVTFTIEGKKYTLQPGSTGTYWHTKVGPVHYGYSYTLPYNGQLGGAGGGAGILRDQSRYAFRPTSGGGFDLMRVGSM